MTFNASEHLTDLRGKQYLEVKWRLVWFKDEHPDGGISTEIINYEPLVIKATIVIGGVIAATGHGTADDSGKNVVWKGKSIEKAETAAIGRALAHAGYGTQFSPDDDEDGVVDSPVQKKATTTPPPAQKPPQANVVAKAPLTEHEQKIILDFMAQPVGKAWKEVREWLLIHVYENKFHMENSIEKWGKQTNGWKGMTAGEVMDYLDNRHKEEAQPQAVNQ